MSPFKLVSFDVDDTLLDFQTMQRRRAWKPSPPPCKVC